MQTMTRIYGAYRVTYERAEGQHRLIVTKGDETCSSNWVQTTLPVTFESGDGTLHIVGQAYTTRLPMLFRLVAGDNERIDLMMN